MGSAIPRGGLAEIVRDALARTGVPGAAAGLLVDREIELAAAGEVALGSGEAVGVETPFRIASVTKWFTASLATLCLDPDAPLAGSSARRLLSHTADWRPESSEPLPEVARGLWSYSNAGYRTVGAACAEACGVEYSSAVGARLLAPLGMAATGFEQPARRARGHVQEGESGHRVVPDDVYREERRPAGGLWSTVGDLLRFAAHQLGEPGPLAMEHREALREPRARALGASYALGCWTRDLSGGRACLDHEGSVGGFQSLLMLLPDDGAALAVLTNSWRGSGLVRRVVQDLGLTPGETVAAAGGEPEEGRFALDDAEATVTRSGGGWRVAEAELDPVAQVRIERPPYPVERLGGGAYGIGGGLLMSHRVDFPRPGVARVGWVALPRSGA